MAEPDYRKTIARQIFRNGLTMLGSADVLVFNLEV